MNDPDPVPEGASAVPSVVPGLTGLAESLAELGYDRSGLRSLLGVDTDLPTKPVDLAIYARRLAAAASPLADVIALLTLGWTRRIDDVARGLGRGGLEVLLSAGAVIERDAAVHPAVRIVPHGEIWLASDRILSPGTTPSALHVTGINPPATLLAALTVRRGVSSALDVGTGNGIQALLAARHCERVIATDVNPRALAFAEFNAALNGIDRIEFRAGSLLEPVAGERFDLIVSNPPYVISPEHDYLFRDSGAEPGALCAELVRALPEHLAPGGYATMLASWPADEPWDAVPRSWLGDNCRAWLLQMRTEDPLLYARQWNDSLADGSDLVGFEAAVDRWVRYLTDRGIGRVGYGAVLLHQRYGESTVIRADTVRAGSGSASGHIERVFAAHDVLADLDDAALAESTCHIASEHRVERAMHFAGVGWRHGDALVALTEGVGIEATIDPLMTEILLRVTSGATIVAAAGEVGQHAGINPEQADDLLAAAIGMMRELISTGMVEPGPAPG